MVGEKTLIDLKHKLEEKICCFIIHAYIWKKLTLRQFLLDLISLPMCQLYTTYDILLIGRNSKNNCLIFVVILQFFSYNFHLITIRIFLMQPYKIE